jgi:Concanavalin A-like lectin/glucanases superfamily/Bacterial Ig-like domain (group 2)
MKTCHSTKIKALLWCLATLAGLQVSARGNTLINRYSFNETSGIIATDSVSSANATLIGGTEGTAAFNGSGQAVLSQSISEDPSSDTNGAYIVLPPNIVSNLTAVTVEAWVIPTLDETGVPWSRIWDFGNSSGGAAPAGIIGYQFARFGDTANGVEADSWTPQIGDNFLFSATPMIDGGENQVVWTGDASTHIGKLYLNGVLLSTIYNFTNSPALVGSTTNDWLGRSQFTDPLANAAYDEFRIYNGALSALQIAADYQNSPDTLANYGTVTALSLSFTSTNIPQGSSQTAQLLATATGLTGPVNIYDDPSVLWTSSNPAIAAVDVHGVVTGLGSGSATIVAVYGSLSATQAVTVFSLPVTMLDRYSFNETSGNTAVDSIAGQNGTLNGTATFNGSGQAVLDGTVGTWVDLPAQLISPTRVTANAVTLETWATANPVNGAWTRIFDFGNIAGNNGANYLFFAPDTAANGGSCRVAVSDSSPGFASEDGFDLNNVLGKTNIHVVVVFNPNPSRKFLGLYINGNLAGSITTTKSYSAIVNDFSFLGRSTYAGDSWLSGSFDEFRIYNGELNKFQIAASDQAGPNNPSFNVGTFTSFGLNPGTLPIAAGAPRQVKAVMNFSLVTNVFVNGDPTLFFSSSAPNVASVDNAGNLFTKSVGSSTITAVYGYVSGGTTTFYTNSTLISVFYDYPATLMHRYSFTTDTSDSVGGPAWAGTLVGSATVSGGQLVLPNVANVVALDYLTLPTGILTNAVDGIGTNGNNPAVTVEAWATVAPAQNTWANLFDFGAQDAGLAAYDIHNCVNGNGGFTVTGISDSDNANIDSQFASSQPALSGNTNIYIVCVFDPPAGYLACYTNGVQMNNVAAVTISMAGVQGILNKIGADNWPDPGMKGSVDEFRIYNGVLHPNEITQNYVLGPNQLPVNAPSLNAVASGGNLLITWTTNGTSTYVLKSSSTLGNGVVWTTVPGTPSQVGGNYQMSVPTTNSSRFFELR